MQPRSQENEAHRRDQQQKINTGTSQNNVGYKCLLVGDNAGQKTNLTPEPQ